MTRQDGPPVTPPGWFPDPLGRHEQRYWDGQQWTEHVASHGRQSVDPVGAPQQLPTVNHSPDKIQQQVQQRAGVVDTSAGGGTIFSEPVLVVNQKAKIIEINNEYAIFAQSGQQIGAVRQVGQSAAKKALRLVSSLDQYLTHSLQIVDASGVVQLAIKRPAKVFKSKFEVTNGAGQMIGSIVQENMVGKIHFGLFVDGQRLGSINAENWRAWNFNIQDANGSEVARITKTWEGLAKTMFTTADNYVVQISPALQDPLRSLVVASALSIDTALKQDKRGFG
ncbi:MAG TPA: phospholipid scramblase-related protein [Acidimicrobiales bacterium]|nr:phospholipid scramblase-related protein [Acidimicrobiales bacterium]